MGAGRPRPSRSLARDAAFARLWVATTASGLATWALPFVLGLAVVADTMTAAAAGVALAARTAGFLVVLPVAGVVADRYTPRLVVAVSGSTAAVAGLPLAWSLGHSTALLVLSAAVVGAGQGACRPAFQALVPQTVPRDRLRTANAAVSVAVRATVLAGPSAAGAASLVIGPAWLVVVISMLWAVAAVAPRRAPRTTHVGPSTSFGAELADGLREARRHPWFVAGLGALAAVITTGYSVTAVAVPIVSRESGSGVLLAATATAYTTGALVAGLVLARWASRNEGWVALAGLAVYAAAPASLALDAPLAVVVATYALVGAGIEAFNVPWFTATQREVPADRLSRVSSLDFVVSYGLAPLGLALIAPAIDRFGLDPVLWACSGACLVAPLLATAARGSRHFAVGGHPVTTDGGPGSDERR